MMNTLQPIQLAANQRHPSMVMRRDLDAGDGKLRKERDQWELPRDLKHATVRAPSINASHTLAFDQGNGWLSSEAVGCLGNWAPDCLIMQILRLRRTACGLNSPLEAWQLLKPQKPKAAVRSGDVYGLAQHPHSNVFSRWVSVIRRLKNAKYYCFLVVALRGGTSVPTWYVTTSCTPKTCPRVPHDDFLICGPVFNKHSWAKSSRGHYANTQVHAKTK